MQYKFIRGQTIQYIIIYHITQFAPPPPNYLIFLSSEQQKEKIYIIIQSIINQSSILGGV